MPSPMLYMKVAAGIRGNAATVAVGSTSTLAEGQSATVTNSGDENDASFVFGIPRGAIPAVGFNFDTSTTDADPGAGDVRFNNATPASVTEIYFDNADRDGNTVTSWLDTFDNSTNTAKGHLVITPAASPSAKLIYNVTGTVTDGTGYRKVTVSHVAGTTLPSSGAHLGFQFAPAGDQGISPATQLTFDSSTTDADPGAGEWRFNNATLASVTAIYIDNVDANGNTITGWLDSFDDNNATASRGIIEFIDISAPSTFFKGRVTGTIVDGTGYRKVTVTHLASNGTFSGLATVTFSPSGDKGADGAGTGDVVGPASAVDGEIALYDLTTGKLIKRASTTGVLKATSGVLAQAVAGTDYYNPGGTDVALADGGTGASLSDPNADRIMFWDDSGGAVTWLTPTGGLEVSNTDLQMSANQRIAAIPYVIDGSGSAITTGVKGFLEIPFACTITRATTLADQTGSIVIDIWKDTYANYPPTVADTITASAKPTLSSATKAQDATLTGWTTSIAAGDVLGFNVDSATTVTRVTLSLRVTKT